MTGDISSLPYHEPGLTTILTLSSFLLLLNVLNSILDKLLYCGLLGQILLGIAWGTPGGKWLDEPAENIVSQLGYLGLLLIVYEGGLCTSFSSLKANLLLSTSVALTGICVPIALSFILQPLAGATSLQAFAAGASLCSTSLGTTFTVLNTSGLTSTRLGVVLATAAMMDDVVGLVMVQVISGLGNSPTICATTVVRPVVVSMAFVIIVPLSCVFVVKPTTIWLNGRRMKHEGSWLDEIATRRETAFLIHTALLIAMVTGAMYAGTSNLFAAYLAGAVISWWDSEIPHIQGHRAEEHSADDRTNVQCPATSQCGIMVYETYYSRAVNTVLKPFFFASIGFSIPVSLLFTGSIVWRGAVYALLMVIGKLACGIWLVRLPMSLKMPKALRWLRCGNVPTFLCGCCRGTQVDEQASITLSMRAMQPGNHHTDCSELHSSQNPDQDHSKDKDGNENPGIRTVEPQISKRRIETRPNETTPHVSPTNIKKPVSLYPACILASAMVARGEIGFLVSAIARSDGVLDQDLFLVVTWAIVLCTILGPLVTGLLVRRVKRLERLSGSVRVEVLGAWGVN